MKIFFQVRLVRDPDIVVADCWMEYDWCVEFKRALSLRDFDRWTELKGELSSIVLEERSCDMVRWGLEKKGHFSTKSLYRFLSDGGVSSRVHGWSPVEV